MLFFDFDGVIADSLPHYQAACLHAIKTLDLPPPDLKNPFSQLENVNFQALASLLGTDEKLLFTVSTPTYGNRYSDSMLRPLRFVTAPVT